MKNTTTLYYDERKDNSLALLGYIQRATSSQQQHFLLRNINKYIDPHGTCFYSHLRTIFTNSPPFLFSLFSSTFFFYYFFHLFISFFFYLFRISPIFFYRFKFLFCRCFTSGFFVGLQVKILFSFFFFFYFARK